MNQQEQTEFNSLDPESRDFITWNFKDIEDDQVLEDLINENIEKARKWLLDNKELVRHKLLLKMLTGAKEHGPPVYHPGRIQNELEMEYLDIIGWNQMGRYHERNREE